MKQDVCVPTAFLPQVVRWTVSSSVIHATLDGWVMRAPPPYHVLVQTALLLLPDARLKIK